MHLKHKQGKHDEYTKQKFAGKEYPHLKQMQMYAISECMTDGYMQAGRQAAHQFPNVKRRSNVKHKHIRQQNPDMNSPEAIAILKHKQAKKTCL